MDAEKQNVNPEEQKKYFLLGFRKKMLVHFVFYLFTFYLTET